MLWSRELLKRILGTTFGWASRICLVLPTLAADLLVGIGRLWGGQCLLFLFLAILAIWIIVAWAASWHRWRLILLDFTEDCALTALLLAGMTYCIRCDHLLLRLVEDFLNLDRLRAGTQTSCDLIHGPLLARSDWFSLRLKPLDLKRFRICLCFLSVFWNLGLHIGEFIQILT